MFPYLLSVEALHMSWSPSSIRISAQMESQKDSFYCVEFNVIKEGNSRISSTICVQCGQVKVWLWHNGKGCHWVMQIKGAQAFSNFLLYTHPLSEPLYVLCHRSLLLIYWLSVLTNFFPVWVFLSPHTSIDCLINRLHWSSNTFFHVCQVSRKRQPKWSRGQINIPVGKDLELFISWWWGVSRIIKVQRIMHSVEKTGEKTYFSSSHTTRA